jgi:superfamily II DNA or RNA helicase
MSEVRARVYAPGARVVIRDEEWIVRSVETTASTGTAVRVTGTSELVRGREAIFLNDLDEIIELRPEDTALVNDPSPHYRRTRLYLESLLRRTPPTDDALYVGHRGAIDVANYQLQPATKALRQLRPRILMADGVGLGKTIEVGILLSELIRRGRGDRILVVALKSILTQFQEELWARFTIPLVRLDSVGIQRVQSRIPSNMNPFYFYDRVIISVDTLKRDEKYRRYLEESRWDVVVVDECQNVAVRGRSAADRSQRSRLAQLLGRTSDALILTSATPHDGRPESFASLMNLLEPTAVADPSNFVKEDVEEFFLRRFKKDIRHEVEGSFKEREVKLHKLPASSPEDDTFELLSKVEFRTIDHRRQSRGILFRTLLLKSFLSSPAACASTIENRLAKEALEDETDADVQHDRAVLTDLAAALEGVTIAEFRKFQHLLRLLRDLGLDKGRQDNRVVVFSERIDTLQFLHKELKRALCLPADAVEVFHGTLDDQKQQKLVKSFGSDASPVRILLASDAASEGINLHYHCHQMVHFDLPWSLITLEQRNGRIDRYGQEQTPHIDYLLTIPGNPDLQGDLRVLDILIEREDAAHRNLGDVAWLMNLHNAEAEEEAIAKGIEEGTEAEEVIPEKPEENLLELLFSTEQSEVPKADRHDPVNLYPDDLKWTREALAEVLGDESDHVEWQEHLEGLILTAPDDLARRLDYLPAELRKDNGRFRLTTSRKRVMDALEDARQHEDRWPEWQLLWEQHPVAQWLNDRVLQSFERHEAPVIKVPRGIPAGEQWVVMEGIVSNRRSQPVLVEWFVVVTESGTPGRILPIGEVINTTGLQEQLSNPGQALNAAQLDDLRGLLIGVIDVADVHMKERRTHRMGEIGEDLRDGLQKLTLWRERRLGQVDGLQLSLTEEGRTIRADQHRRMDDERHEIELIFKDRREWIEQSMRTVPEPYLRVAAVLIGQQG